MSAAPQFAADVERLRRHLAKIETAPRERLANNRKAAAVLVPIFERAGELHVVYIRRSDLVESHRGQVAFPGGRVDPGDATLLDAALREAEEEVAIVPSSVDILGALPVASTYTSGILVAPFAGVIPESTAMRPNPGEIADVFDVPLSALRDLRYRGDYEWRRDGANSSASKYPAIFYGGQTIWGLTLRITLNLLEMLHA